MRFLFLGGDKRYEYMMRELCSEHSVFQVGFDISNPDILTLDLEGISFSDFDAVLFPISGLSDNLEIKTMNGLLKVPEVLFKESSSCLFFTGLKTKKLLELLPVDRVFSFLDFPEVEAVNNDLTVRGTLDFIKDIDYNSVCIMGYGNLGKALYLNLRSSGVKTFVLSRPKALIYEDNVDNFYPLCFENVCHVFRCSDIVINTIPFNVVPEEAISGDFVPYVLDIASFPYGIDEKLVAKYSNSFKYDLYLGIPSKFAPKEASDILLKAFKEVILKK